MEKRKLMIIPFLLFSVVASCQTNQAKQQPTIDLRCKSKSFYECSEGECKKESTQALEFSVSQGVGSVSIYSIQTKDPSPKVFLKNGKTQFFIESTGESVNDEKVEVSILGQLSSSKEFQAIVDGVHYQGSCD